MTITESLVQTIMNRIGPEPVFFSDDIESITLIVENSISLALVEISTKEKENIIKNVQNNLEKSEIGTNKILAHAGSSAQNF